MWWILGKYSTRIQLTHHQFCPSFCIPVNFWTTSTCLLMHNLIVGSRSSFQGLIQNLKICRLLCAEDWWLVHHQSKTNTSMKSVPSQLSSLDRSHLIVQTPIFQICRTSVSLWDLFNSWWNANCLSNSSPWIQMLAMLKTCTFLISQNALHCLLFHPLRIVFVFFAPDHSPCARMIWILTTNLILLRRLQWRNV